MGVGKSFTSPMRFEPVASHVCCAMLIVLLVIIGLVAIGIIKVVMGAVYMDDCSKQELVPVYLIASGASTVLLSGLYAFKPRADEKQWRCMEKLNIYGIVGLLAMVFYFVWLFYGCFLIFGIFSDVIDGCPGQTTCCDSDLIKFALFTLALDLIVCASLIVGLVLLVSCCCCVKEPLHDRLDSAGH